MNKLFGFCMFLIFLGCGPSKIVSTDPANIPPSNSSTTTSEKPKVIAASENQKLEPVSLKVNTEIEFSEAAQVKNIISFLASDELKGRESGSEGIEKAANFIENIFRENGVHSYFESYKDTLSNFQEPAYYNVVGFLEGNDDKLKKEFVVLGAHYDHIGMISAVQGDSIANGANDNASGTTTVLELARYFGTSKSNKRSIIFALFSAEEKGLLGSAHLAKKLKAQNIDLYTMLNFEMVGVPLQDKDYFMYVSGYEKSNLAEVANQYVGDKLIGFLPTAAQMNLFQRSDNYAFHQEFNIPSQTFCTFDFTNFDHYHKVGDEADIMNFEHMAEVVNRVIPAMVGIINAPIKEIKYN